MVLVVVFVAFPSVSVGGRGAGLETKEYLMDSKAGEKSSQLVGHESTHPGASKVG